MSINYSINYSENYLDLVRAYPTKYELHEIEALVDKIISYLSKKESNFFYNLLSENKQTSYKEAQKSYTFFIPFVEKNIKLVMEKVKSSLNLENDEPQILATDIFEISLRKSIFNDSFIGDIWFTHKNN